jgi:hypothetical protein
VWVSHTHASPHTCAGRCGPRTHTHPTHTRIPPHTCAGRCGCRTHTSPHTRIPPHTHPHTRAQGGMDLAHARGPPPGAAGPARLQAAGAPPRLPFRATRPRSPGTAGRQASQCSGEPGRDPPPMRLSDPPPMRLLGLSASPVLRRAAAAATGCSSGPLQPRPAAAAARCCRMSFMTGCEGLCSMALRAGPAGPVQQGRSSRAGPAGPVQQGRSRILKSKGCQYALSSVENVEPEADERRLHKEIILLTINNCNDPV